MLLDSMSGPHWIHWLTKTKVNLVVTGLWEDALKDGGRAVENLIDRKLVHHLVDFFNNIAILVGGPFVWGSHFLNS